MPSAFVRRVAAAATAFVAGVTAGSSAHAGGNDVDLARLCEPRTTGPLTECSWIVRQGNGLITRAAPDEVGESRFRSLVSELGVALAPRVVVPAETLGFAGFQLAGAFGVTTISHHQPFWNGVEAVSPQNPTAARPSAALSTIGAFVRKGVWLGLPSVELGAGAMHLIDSHLISWQGYAKVALHEGYPRLPLPSLALRGSASYVTGTAGLRMNVLGVDVLVSKPFGVAGTFRVEPFIGASALFIDAKSGRFDLTPGCDAVATQSAGSTQPLGPGCTEAQRGTDNDSLATVSFAKQSRVRRTRFFGGIKARLSPVFLTAEFELAPEGRSRDKNRPGGVRDESGVQRTVSLNAGLDF